MQSAMKERNVLFVIVFSLVTLGLYSLYWLLDTRREMLARGAKVPSSALLLLPALAFIVAPICMLLLILSVVGDTDPAWAGMIASQIVLLLVFIVALLAAAPLAVYFFYRYCQAVDTVTRGEMPFNLSFGLWLVLVLISVSGLVFAWFAWPGIIQYGFNRVSAEATPQPKV